MADHVKIGEGNKGFIDHNCAYTNCYLTLDKSKMYEVDAVLLHGHDVESTKTLRAIHKKRISMDKKAPIYVYYNKEPPR